MVDNGESLSMGEPQPDGEVPVTKDTKQRLAGVFIDRIGPATKAMFPPEIAELVGDVGYLSLTSKERDGTVVDIDVVHLPRGNSDMTNLRWAAILEKEHVQGLLEQYLLREIPDGWDLERHERMHTEADQAAALRAMDEEDVAFLKGQYDANRDSKQLSRELGMAGVTEDQAKRLIRLLETAKLKD